MATSNGINGQAVDVSVALAPNNLEAVPQLIKELGSSAHTVGEGNDQARHELLIKARSLVQALETPRETMIKHCWAQTGAMAGLMLGVDTGLWAHMAKNGDKPQKVGDLANELGIETSLLSRLMRHLGAMGYVEETAEDEYKPTNYSKAMSIPIIGEGYFPMLAGASAGAIQFHEFARKRNWRTPTNAKDTSMQMAYKMETDFFTWQQQRGYGPAFNNHMGGYRQGRMPWMHSDFFPVKERLISGADTSPDAPFIVDVGGSVGHDLVEFKKYHPDHPGQLVLQDLPVVIDQIQELDSKIKRQSHDFLTEQPAKGARAYYMHSVLHDWPDDVCNTILTKLKEAMKPGYSKILINENVIPRTNAYWETTALDMVMLAYFSSKERTEEDWNKLISDAGLKITKIWSGGKGVESLIEVELA